VRFLLSKKSGFTLIEVLVVVAIVAALGTAVIGNLAVGRTKARDTQRMNDLAQLQIALRLYKDANGAYPEYDAGVIVGEGSAFDAAMLSFFPSIPSDPMGPSDSTYEYFYGSEVHCRALDNSKRYIVLLARTMEKTSNANWATTCDSTNPFKNGSASDQTYGIVLGEAN
jgi:prepilin-type N-terminal cleavage/methylation domain-containing protein